MTHRRPAEPPVSTARERNAARLELELAWFRRVLEARFQVYFQQEGSPASIDEIEPPALGSDDSAYARLVRDNQLGFAERLVLLLALIPHLRPQLLDDFFIRNNALDRPFTEFGGWSGKTHGGFLPTCETAAFLLAGSDLAERFDVMRILDSDHFFFTAGILAIDARAPGEPLLSGALRVSTDALHRLTTGILHKPDYSEGFPAKRLTTPLEWSDLVLAPESMQAISQITAWIRHSETILREWGLARTLKPGYRSLFYGPPGTGKTLTACLVGESAGLDVYRIDLSMVVSKYIGETQKNLANVFDQAEHKRWVLLFDEADALFGKRTKATTSNDRHANQEIAYLLQRVEDFPGVVILATNLKSNIDTAFARRFQSVVHFPMPDAEERLRLWGGALGGRERLAPDVDLEKLAAQWELSGGAITNVVRYAAISALQASRDRIAQRDLVAGITRELRKEGKTP